MFAPRTPDGIKVMVGKILTPQAMMDAYRNARALCGTTDIVLHHSDQDPNIYGGTRREFCVQHLLPLLGERASKLKIWKHSAQSEVMLPSDSDAFWLVIEGRHLDAPIACVLYATPYEQEAVTLN